MLGVTTWAVSDTRPMGETSWWPSISAGAALLYGGLMPAILLQGESHLSALRFLALAVLTHLLPFGAAGWYAINLLPATAYSHLAVWCLGTLSIVVAMTVGGALWRLRPRTPPR